MGVSIREGDEKNMSLVSRKYLDWVAKQPCIFHGTRETVVPHHIRSLRLGAGMGLKSPDINTIPVCYECHANCHNKTINLETQLMWCLQTINKALESGAISYG